MNFEILSYNNYPIKTNIGLFLEKDELESGEEIVGYSFDSTVTINEGYKENPSIILSKEELVENVYKQVIARSFDFARKSVYQKEFSEELEKQLLNPALEKKILKFFHGTSLKEFEEGYNLYMSFGNFTPHKANILLAKLFKDEVVEEEIFDVV